MSAKIMESIYANLEKKALLFAEYESVTKKLTQCTEEETEKCLSHRAELAEKIDAITQKITELAATAKNPLLSEALSTACQREGLAEDMAKVYDLSAGIRAVCSRVADMDKFILHNMEDRREELKKLIAKANAAPTAQISKYYSPISDSPRDNLLGEKSRRG